MRRRNWRKEIGIYLLAWGLVAVIVFFGVRARTMLMNSGRFREMVETRVSGATDDPCENQLVGGPGGAGDKYVKVNFKCWDSGKESRNSFDLRVFQNSKVRVIDVLKEMGRVNGFVVIDDEGLVMGRYRDVVCRTGGVLIEDINREVTRTMDISCDLGSGK